MNCTNETIFLIIALIFAGVFIVLRHLYAERHPRCIHCGKRSRRKNWRPVNYYKSKIPDITFVQSVTASAKLNFSMLKAHRFHVKFTVHTIMSEGGDVAMEEDYTLSYRTEEWEPESPNNLKFSKTHIQGATGIIAKDLGVHRSQIRVTDIYKVHNSLIIEE